MAAPPITTRSTPSKPPLREGFSIKGAFSLNPAIEFWEMDVKPPAIDGGEQIPISTQFNVQWKTFWTRTLLTIGDIEMSGSYSAHLYADIVALINKVGGFTIIFPDGDTLSMWAHLKRFDPQTQSEGSQPRASFTISVDNYDPANNVEAGPVFTAATGTG